MRAVIDAPLRDRFVRNRKRNESSSHEGGWSGQQDLNLRPAVPKTAALPGCAIPRPVRYWIAQLACRQQAERDPPPAQWLPKIDPVTRSPGAMWNLRAVPAITSRTARTGPPDGMRSSDIGLAFSATRNTCPSPRMKIMSSEM